jgi:hypothetical protein
VRKNGGLTGRNLPEGIPEKSPLFMELTCCSITSRSRDTDDYELKLTWMPCPLQGERVLSFQGDKKRSCERMERGDDLMPEKGSLA